MVGRATGVVGRATGHHVGVGKVVVRASQRRVEIRLLQCGHGRGGWVGIATSRQELFDGGSVQVQLFRARD